MYKHVMCVSMVMESHVISTQSWWYTACLLRQFFPLKPPWWVTITTPSIGTYTYNIYRHIYTTHTHTHSIFCTIQHGRNYLGMRNSTNKCFPYLHCKQKVIIDSLSSKWSLSFLRSIPGSWGKDWVAGHGLFHHLLYRSTSIHPCVVLGS